MTLKISTLPIDNGLYPAFNVWSKNCAKNNKPSKQQSKPHNSLLIQIDCLFSLSRIPSVKLLNIEADAEC